MDCLVNITWKWDITPAPSFICWEIKIDFVAPYVLYYQGWASLGKYRSDNQCFERYISLFVHHGYQRDMYTEVGTCWFTFVRSVSLSSLSVRLRRWANISPVLAYRFVFGALLNVGQRHRQRANINPALIQSILLVESMLHNPTTGNVLV